MKKYSFVLLVLFLVLGFFNSYSVTQGIEDKVFQGVDLTQTEYKFEDEEFSNHYNIAYSPFLPAGGIYHITDQKSGKKAIVQIGIAQVDKSPYSLYLPQHLYQFFASSYDTKVDKIDFKLKFLGWNREGEESLYLDVLSLIIQPEESIDEISKNGLDKHYIQIGAFSFYQNSYPQIINSLPYLDIIPHFYLIEKNKDNEEKMLYQILAGPYSLETAREVVKKINRELKKNMYIHSGESIISQYGR